jgi:hypothetical protein
MIRRWTLCFTLFLLLTGILDVLSTYHASPDLSGELNPLIVAMGRSWEAVFLVKGTTLLIAPTVFSLSLHVLAQRSKRLCDKKGFAEIMSYLIFKKQVTLTGLSVALPKDLGAVAAFLGICIALSPPASAALGAITNTFHLVTSVTRVYLFYILAVLLVTVLAHYLVYRFLSILIQSEQSVTRGAR